MYFGDHLPPHFHAEYAEFTAQISIRELGIVEGYLPPKALGSQLVLNPFTRTLPPMRMLPA